MFDDIFEAQKRQLAINFSEAVFEMHLNMSDRIFNENKDINGQAPRPYDTKPLWASKKAYANVRLGGKPSKTGKTHYFEGGYSQLKSESGRPPIELTTKLRNSWTNGLREVNEFEYVIEIPKEDNDKVRGNFVNFFKISKKEKDNLLKGVIGD